MQDSQLPVLCEVDEEGGKKKGGGEGKGRENALFKRLVDPLVRIEHERSMLDNPLLQRLARDQHEPRLLFDGRVGRGELDARLPRSGSEDDRVVRLVHLAVNGDGAGQDVDLTRACEKQDQGGSVFWVEGRSGKTRKRTKAVHPSGISLNSVLLPSGCDRTMSRYWQSKLSTTLPCENEREQKEGGSAARVKREENGQNVPKRRVLLQR